MIWLGGSAGWRRWLTHSGHFSIDDEKCPGWSEYGPFQGTFAASSFHVLAFDNCVLQWHNLIAGSVGGAGTVSK
jgi:hypothetical protein